VDCCFEDLLALHTKRWIRHFYIPNVQKVVHGRGLADNRMQYLEFFRLSESLLCMIWLPIKWRKKIMRSFRQNALLAGGSDAVASLWLNVPPAALLIGYPSRVKNSQSVLRICGRHMGKRSPISLPFATIGAAKITRQQPIGLLCFGSTRPFILWIAVSSQNTADRVEMLCFPAFNETSKAFKGSFVLLWVCVTLNHFDTNIFLFTANAYRLSVPLITNNRYRIGPEKTISVDP